MADRADDLARDEQRDGTGHLDRLDLMPVQAAQDVPVTRDVEPVVRKLELEPAPPCEETAWIETELRIATGRPLPGGNGGAGGSGG